MYNMYALERNSWKFRARDKRLFKAQHIESAYLAPDTVAEIIHALALLEQWAGKEKLISGDADFYFTVKDRILERSRQPVKILKPCKGYAAYREMLIYYAVKTLLEFFDAHGGNFALFQAAHTEEVSLVWVNIGGQLVPEKKVDALRAAIREGRLTTWDAIHAEYARLAAEYPLDLALNALQVMRYLCDSRVVNPEQWRLFIAQSQQIRVFIEEQVYKTKRKDYTDPFRAITYRNDAERDAVLGSLADNPFIKTAREDSARFFSLTEKLNRCKAGGVLNP
jgi:hypothetical protein